MSEKLDLIKQLEAEIAALKAAKKPQASAPLPSSPFQGVKPFKDPQFKNIGKDWYHYEAIMLPEQAKAMLAANPDGDKLLGWKYAFFRGNPNDPQNWIVAGALYKLPSGYLFGILRGQEMIQADSTPELVDLLNLIMK